MTVETFLMFVGIALVTTLCLVILIAAVGAAYVNVEKIRAAAEFALALEDDKPSSTSWHPSENL